MPERAAASNRFPRGRAWRAGALLLLLAPPLFVLARCASSPAIPFLRQSATMPWIAPALPVSAELRQWGRNEVPVARFEKRFRAAAGEEATLRLRALRRFQVALNGRALPGGRGEGPDWRRETRIALGPGLREGENLLQVEVSNPHGPPLLSLRVDGLAAPLASDASWTVHLEGQRLPAVLADDTRIEPTSLATETPAEAWRRRADTGLGLFALGVLGFLALRRWPRAARALPAAVLAAACLGWTALFAAKLVHIPPEVGFDARHHLEYVELLRQGHLPLASDGWSTFHPPLFYAAALAAGDSRGARKALPLAAGLAAVGCVFAAARRLFPGDPLRQALATGFAALLPVHLYSSAYFSNESLHTLLASLALLATLALLAAERVTPLRAAGVGALFGLAALTKFSVLLLLPVAAAVLALRWPTHWRAGLAALGAFAGVAGWFYLRNAWVFGDPLMANWGEMPGPGQRWWQHPGFHTAAYYGAFGEALVHPYLSGFHSFWDSVYSTFWGDGFVGGRVRASDRHGFWSYDFMSMGYWAALPATGLLALGGWEAARRAWSEPDPARRAAFGLLVGCAWWVGFGFLYLTLRLPFFAQAKATYVLGLLVPLAAFFALGAARADAALARWTPARALFWGWLAVCAGTLFLGFAG